MTYYPVYCSELPVSHSVLWLNAAYPPALLLHSFPLYTVDCFVISTFFSGLNLCSRPHTVPIMSEGFAFVSEHFNSPPTAELWSGRRINSPWFVLLCRFLRGIKSLRSYNSYSVCQITSNKLHLYYQMTFLGEPWLWTGLMHMHVVAAYCH